MEYYVVYCVNAKDNRMLYIDRITETEERAREVCEKYNKEDTNGFMYLYENAWIGQ